MTFYPITRSAPVLLSLVCALGQALGANALAADPAADHAPAAAKPAKAPSAPERTAAPEAHDSATAKKTVPLEGLPAATGNPMAEKIRAAMAGTVVASKG